MQYSNKQKLAVFASGAGSNAHQLFEYFKDIDDVSIELVVCNRKNAGVVEKAREANLSVEYMPKSMIYDSNMLEQLLSEREIDFIVLSGFLLKIPASITKQYPDRILNIHPSLLPKFGGVGMYGMHVHEAVKAAGENQTGISIHVVNEVFDDGEVIFQAQCEIDVNDTPESIQKKVQVLEHSHFAKVVHEYITHHGNK